jgi:hypothetical protein
VSRLSTPPLELERGILVPSKSLLLPAAIQASRLGHQGLLQASGTPAIATGTNVVFGSSTAAGGTTSAITVTGGACVIALVVTGSTTSSTPTVSSSRDGSMTAIGTHTQNNGTASGGNIFQLLTFFTNNATAGSTTWTVNDPGGGFPTVIVLTFNNGVYDAIASAYAVQNGTSPFVSANITTNANTGFLVGACGSAQAGTTVTYSGSNSFSADVQETNNASFWTGVIGHKAYSGATTDHAAFTNTATPSATDATTITLAVRQAP